jgi:acetyl esterase/lipase
MLRWLLFTLALALFVTGLLTIIRSPAWSPWQLALLAGEFGHWLALAAIPIGVMAWNARGAAAKVALVTIALCAFAAVLLLKPTFQAWRMASSLPEKLTAQFGMAPTSRPAFSVSELFLGEDPASVPIKTITVSEGLPLDFYPPVGSRGPGPAPCVVVVHGGGWNGGDRGQLPLINRWLAHRGYAVAAISYRLAPAFIWPAQRDDVLAALTLLKTMAGELDIDPDRLVLLGRSAGGQIALATAYAVNDPAVRGVVGLYAPADLIFGYVNTHENDALNSPALMRQFLGGTPYSARANYESASAQFHVTKRAPPTLLLHGENDALTWYRHSVRLEERLSDVGVPGGLVLMPWATHAFDYTLHGPGGQLTTFALEWFLHAVTR